MPKDVLGQLGLLTLEEKRAVEEAERVRQRAATHAMDGPSRRPRARGYELARQVSTSIDETLRGPLRLERIKESGQAKTPGPISACLLTTALSY